MSADQYKQAIQEGIKGLPKDTLAEIARFVYFLRQGLQRPEALDEEMCDALIRCELKQLSRDEERHLEKEFEGYEQS
jgi:hypothetical protein